MINYVSLRLLFDNNFNLATVKSFFTVVFLDDYVLEDLESQRQVICALNVVLYEQLQYKGNDRDYYNPLNSYIHQVNMDTALCLIYTFYIYRDHF